MEDDRIVEVAEDGRALTAGDVDVLDAGGGTLMPGLIDAHVHAAIATMDLEAMGGRSPPGSASRPRPSSSACCAGGFTTVRDAGGLVGVQESLRLGLIRGPRAGEILHNRLA